MTEAHRDECLAPDDVVAMLQGRLEPGSLGVVEQHVAVCSACRELLSALAQIEAPVGPAVADDGGTASTMPSDDELAELSSGQYFGRYVILAPLGAGAMGAVYA